MGKTAARRLEVWDVRDIPPVKHGDISPADQESARCVEFSVNDWAKGSVLIRAERAGEKALVSFDKGNYFLFKVSESNQKEITGEQFDAFIESLLTEYNFLNWNAEYRDPNLLDGINWKIAVFFGNQPPLVRRGSNAFPPCWDEVCSAFEHLIR